MDTSDSRAPGKNTPDPTIADLFIKLSELLVFLMTELTNNVIPVLYGNLVRLKDLSDETFYHLLITAIAFVLFLNVYKKIQPYILPSIIFVSAYAIVWLIRRDFFTKASVP